MAAFESDHWKNSTSGESRDYGWKSYSCGCQMTQPDKPNTSTYVHGPCPMHKNEVKIKLNRAQRRARR